MLFALRADAVRHGGTRRTSRYHRCEPGPAHRAPRTAAGVARRAGPGGGLLDRGRYVRRGALHGLDDTVEGSLQAAHQPEASDRRLLLVARVTRRRGWRHRRRCSSIYLGTVTQALTIFYALLGVTFFVPVLGGLFVRRARAAPGARGHCGRRDHVARRWVRTGRASPLARSDDDWHCAAAAVACTSAP